jgi:biopolymer transport protein TolR
MGMSLGGGGGLNSEINVTPLVDVMLVLLVVFMVTAPMLNTGVDIDLPETRAANVEDPDGALSLSISKAGEVFLGARKIKWVDLQSELARSERVQAEKELYIEADKNLPYSVVVTAMAVAQAAGVTKLQMLTDSNAQLPLENLDKMGSSASAPSPPPKPGE